MTETIVTRWTHIWHGEGAEKEDVMATAQTAAPPEVAPFTDTEGEYRGYTYRIKGDNRVELTDPVTGAATMHKSVANVIAWVDWYESLPDPEPAVPVVETVDPATAATTDAEFLITVTGAGFIGSSVILFDGGELATMHGSDPNVLTAMVDPSGATTGDVPVGVRQGGVDSNFLTFTWT